MAAPLIALIDKGKDWLWAAECTQLPVITNILQLVRTLNIHGSEEHKAAWNASLPMT